MRMREVNPRWSMCFVLAPFVVLVCLGGLAAAAQDNLLQSLIEKNEATWQKIQSLHSIQYTIEREWPNPQSQQPFHGVGQVKKRGNCYWSTYRHTIPMPTGPSQVVAVKEKKVGDFTATTFTVRSDTSAGLTQEIEFRLVVNDRYWAEWTKTETGNALGRFAQQQDYSSVDGMSAKMKQMVRMRMPPEFLRHCFGGDRERFRESMARGAEAVKFEAVEWKGEDGRLLYQIKRSHPQTGPTPDLVWVLDPQKGFLATESTFSPGGRLLVRRTMRAEEIAPGIWYPVGYEETRYAEAKDSADAPVVESWVKSKIRDIKINEPLPDEQFDLEALGLKKDKPDIKVMRTALNGRVTPYVYRDGKLVPRDKPAE